MASNYSSPGSVGAFASHQPEQRQIKIIRAPTLSLSSLPGQVKQLVYYRDLLYTLSLHRIKVRYKQSMLGIAWAVLQPVSLMLIYTVVFSLIARMPSNDTPYAVFSYTALLIWTYFSTALSNATNGLVSHSQLVTKVYFPREILPLTYVIAALFDLVIASTVLGGLLIYYHIPLTLNVLYTIPIILILTVFVTAASLFFSALQVRFRDIGMAMPLLLQLWMFASPVIYPLSAVPARLRPVYMLNPMAGIVDNFRQVVLQGDTPNLKTLGISALLSLVLLVASYVFFKRVEATVADVI